MPAEAQAMGFELAPPARETRDLPLHYIEVDTRGSFKLKVNANPAQPFGARDCNGILDWQINPPIEIGVASKTIGLKIGGFQFIIIIIIYYYKVIIITLFSKPPILKVLSMMFFLNFFFTVFLRKNTK